MNTISVTYRRTSRLSMRIGKQGEVRVSAPYGIAKTEVERFVSEHQEWIEKAVAKTKEQQEKREAFYNRLPLSSRKERAEAVERLNKIVIPLIAKYSEQMGVVPLGIRYRATISRWGCCNVKTKVIQFSTYLLLLSEWCIESIVVHELAHLLVPNHGEKFYAVMDKHYPKWREARKEIRMLQKDVNKTEI